MDQASCIDILLNIQLTTQIIAPQLVHGNQSESISTLISFSLSNCIEWRGQIKRGRGYQQGTLFRVYPFGSIKPTPLNPLTFNLILRRGEFFLKKLRKDFFHWANGSLLQNHVTIKHSLIIASVWLVKYTFFFLLFDPMHMCAYFRQIIVLF